MSEIPAYSVALAPSARIVEHARAAADLGYERIWVYDSPALYGDVWIALARIADAVPRVGLATGVAVPTLRHPMVTSSAIATIEDTAPGRLWAYFGTGFTARAAMGQPGGRWADLAVYIDQVRRLLSGEVVEVDGEACQMLHSPGWGPVRPIEVPLGLAPIGPKGMGVSERVADGVILTAPPEPGAPRWDDMALLVNGTVLGPDEDHTSSRVMAAVGPAYATGFHAVWEWAPDALSGAPGGEDWLARVESDRPPGQRHLAIHEGHLVAVTDRDRPLVLEAGPALLDVGWTGTARDVADRFAQAGAAGITEVVYGPAGPDVEGELRSFAAAATLARCV